MRPWWASLILLVSSGLSQAEPSQTVVRLIGEPASMLDIGMVKLRLQLLHYVAYQPGMAINGITPDADARYDWDQNRIVIDLTYLQPVTVQNSAKLPDDCRSIIAKLRQLLAWNTIAYPFQHEGYHHQDEPLNLQDELNKITVLRLFAVTELQNNKRGNFQCEGALLGKEISVITQ